MKRPIDMVGIRTFRNPLRGCGAGMRLSMRKVLELSLDSDSAGKIFPGLQRSQGSGASKVVDVLEEISYTADPELDMVILSRHAGLLRNIRAVLARIEEEAFGFCPCCRTTNRRGLNNF